MSFSTVLGHSFLGSYDATCSRWLTSRIGLVPAAFTMAMFGSESGRSLQSFSRTEVSMPFSLTHSMLIANVYA